MLVVNLTEHGARIVLQVEAERIDTVFTIILKMHWRPLKLIMGTLGGKDQKHCWLYGLPLPAKGVGDWSCKALAEQLRLAGHCRMVIRCDSERAMLSFKTGVSKFLQQKYG